MAKNKSMENEALGVELKEDQKTHVKFMSEIAKSTLDTPTVLKGGTALLLAYDLDRFSEDLDFDSTKAFNLEKRINDSAKKSNVKVNKILLKKGSVARTSESEERLVFRHNYPAKAIN
ncbi:nucleotidyl transferase AbiEii/AbiGii toxin family protein, partial [methanotrophic endosymbiont of Bathymodiolus puteoserpentis (Logatchev)]|uniref:nucleotidyl transferase AbiEii/AbiGii toxin family protein n=1 Tax=methanotrophic endosymbiont of Bathymodiolus puteoserpentis (Logatchev) TaxID=343235 RepID=UPI001FDA9A1A